VVDGVTNIAVADLDGDKDLDILLATGANNSEPDYYFVYDLNSKTRLWQSTHYEGKFTAFDIGDLKNDHAETEIDATKKYVTPGFIDVNNHSDTYWRIFLDPTLESLLYQGVTTVIGGNCGSSLAPLASHEVMNSIQKWTDMKRRDLTDENISA